MNKWGKTITNRSSNIAITIGNETWHVNFHCCENDYRCKKTVLTIMKIATRIKILD